MRFSSRHRTYLSLSAIFLLLLVAVGHNIPFQIPVGLEVLERGELPVPVANTPATSAKNTSLAINAAAPHAYVTMAGTLDRTSTRTRQAASLTSGWVAGFQTFEPMKFITIKNTGAVPMVNPTLLINGKGPARTVEELVQRIVDEHAAESQKALLLYEYLRDLHQAGSPVKGALHARTLQTINAVGTGDCGVWGTAFLELLTVAGLKARIIDFLGHSVLEVDLGGPQVFDVHYEFLAPTVDGKRFVSLATLLTDKTVRDKTQGTPSGMMLRLNSIPEYQASLTQLRPDLVTYIPSAPPVFTLWPGESWTFDWADHSEIMRRDRIQNSYYPDPSLVATFERPIYNAATYELSSPTFFLAANLVLQNSAPTTVEFSLDNKLWKAVGTYSRGSTEIDLSQLVDRNAEPEIRRFYVKIRGGRPSGSLRAWSQVASGSLPTLQIGANKVELQTDTPKFDATVSLDWLEALDAEVPAIVDDVLLPSESLPLNYGAPLALAWRPPNIFGAAAIDSYEVWVSDDPEIRWALSSNFWQLLPKMKKRLVDEVVLDASFFHPGKKYYWKVRARNSFGYWGPWSPKWHFSIAD